MSIEFDGSTDYFELTGTDITSNFTGYPTSLFCYVYYSSLTTNITAASLADDSVDTKWSGLNFLGSSWTGYRSPSWTMRSTTPYLQSRGSQNGAYNGTDQHDAPPTISTWYKAAFCSITSGLGFLWHEGYGIIYARESDLDGPLTWISPDNLTIGRRGRLTKDQYWNGRIAHVAVWNNYQLTFGDIQNLSDGALPTELGASSDAGLFDYWAMDTEAGSAGNQTGSVNSYVLTAGGTPVYAANPTISGRGTATLSLVLRDAAGAAQANLTGLRWWYYADTPANVVTNMLQPAATGSGATTDASGNFSVTSITGPGVAAGDGYIVITDSDGLPASSQNAGAIAVTLT